MANKGLKIVKRNNLDYLVVDVSALAHRSYHGNRLSTSDGRHSGHIYGSVKSLSAVVRDFEPRRVVFAYDRGGAQWRRELLDKYPVDGKAVNVEKREGYKRNRDSGQDDGPVSGAHDAVREVEDLLKCFPGLHLEIEGFEADDAIAAFTLSQREHQNKTVAIYSGDRDMFQLVSDEHGAYVLCFRRSKGKSETVKITESEVMSEFGCTVAALPYVRALSGDSSDNIQGVVGASRVGKNKGIQQLVDLCLSGKSNYFDRKVKKRKDVIIPEEIPEWLRTPLLEQRKRLLANFRVMSLQYAASRLLKKSGGALPGEVVKSSSKLLARADEILADFECSSLTGTVLRGIVAGFERE